MKGSKIMDPLVKVDELVETIKNCQQVKDYIAIKEENILNKMLMKI